MRNLLFRNKLCSVFLSLCFVLLVSVNPHNIAFGQDMSFQQHEIKGHDTVYSQFIPLYGTFSVQMKYSIPVEIHNTELIHAGNSFDVLVTVNKPGKIVTTFLQDENVLGTSKDELKIGEEKIIEIPESWVGQVFAMPHIQVKPTVTGPATITPESMLFDSEALKKFQVFVEDDIGAFDSLQINLDTTIKMKNGGNLNLAIAQIPLGEHVSDIQTNAITKQIHLEKIIPTNLHLQVKPGDISEHIKVKTTLTDDLQMPIEMQTRSVEIYVDGIPQIKVMPNEWSEDIFVGEGTHNFQARFSDTRDSSNIAIKYNGADSAIQTITVVSSNNSTIQDVSCESGMILKDNQCAKDETRDGVFGMEEGGGCLIATATYGTELAPQVQFLREIRDNTVMNTSSGAAFMTGFNQVYYSFSPTIADMERENPYFREMTKILILPMISTLSLFQFYDIDSEFDLVTLGISIIALNLGIYVLGPIILIRTIYMNYKNKRRKYRISKPNADTFDIMQLERRGELQ